MGVKRYTFVDYATQSYASTVALILFFFHNATVPGWPWLVVAHIFLLVIIHGLVTGDASYRPGSTLSFLRHFYPVLLYTFFFWETGEINRLFFPDYLDPVVIRWEQTLFGCQPSIVFMEKLPSVWVSEMFYAAYFSYYLMIVGVGIRLFIQDRDQFFHYLSITSFLFYVCYLIYIVLPIIGPRVFLHEISGYSPPADIQRLAPSDLYPEAVKSGLFFRIMAVIYRFFESPGSAIPSSHVAVALCTVSFSFRYLRPIRYAHLAAALLLCVATIYCRYHYVFDVVTGALTAAILVSLGNKIYFLSLKRLQPEVEIIAPLKKETADKDKTGKSIHTPRS